MNNKILILGKGFIGSRLQEEFGWDISDRIMHTFKEAEEEVKKFNPQATFPTMVIDDGRVVIIGFQPEEFEKQLKS